MAANDRDNQSAGRKTSLADANNPYQLNYRFNLDAGITRGTGADWFGPLNPIEPTAPDDVKGRVLDFPSGYNLTIQTRAYEAITFNQLRAFADSYDLLRLVIETRKDQMSRLQWNIVVRDHAKDKAKDPATLEMIQRIERFFVRPDGVHFWADWIRMVMEDLLVLDAPAIYRRRTYGGDLYALEPIDGGTIKRVIDDWGRTPQYPVPAYQQVLKGFPALDYTTRELIYRPRNNRTHKIYGLSPVEQIIMTINIGIRRQVWQLQSFTEGNIPEALIGTPSTWTPDQIRSFQDWFDGMLEGNTGERRRARFVPGEVAKGYVPTKNGELFGQAEEWLARVVCYAFSVSPQPFIAMMNRATAETAQETAAQEGLAPLQQWVKGLIDSILMDDFGTEDLEFQWFDEEELDPNIKSQILDREVGSGLLTMNEARAEKGLDPFDHEGANRPMFKSAQGYSPIFHTPEEEAAAEEMRAQISGQAPDGNGPPDQGKGQEKPTPDEEDPGGEPVVATPEDSNPASKMAKGDHADCPTCLAKGDWNEEDHPRDENGRFGSGGGSEKEETSSADVAPQMTDELFAGLVQGQMGNTVEQLHEKAVENQKSLKEVGERIAKEIPGVKFVLPPGENDGVKKLSGAIEKLDRKEGYGPENLTDLSRASFVVDSPEAADAAAAALANAFGGKAYDEGWKVQPESLYRDRKMLIEFPNKGVGEMQLLSQGMYNAKFKEGGHDLYEKARDPSTPREEAVKLSAQMRDLYSAAEKNTVFQSFKGGSK